MHRRFYKTRHVLLALTLCLLAAAALEGLWRLMPMRSLGPFELEAAERNGSVLNVREFGAKGDGVTDDTAAIQRAIDSAGRGATISFPRGVYLVANFAVKNRSGLTFLGEGRDSVIKQKSGAERFATVDG